MPVIKAQVKSELLSWARDRAKVTAEDAAKAANVTVERLVAWETPTDDDRPTLGQLRSLAEKYRFPLAVFFLPEPPRDFAPLRDFRRIPDVPESDLSPNLAYHIRSAYERRELALELSEDLRERPAELRIRASLDETPEEVGRRVREFLGVNEDSQRRAAGQAFDYWRRRLEERGVLVFVVSGPHYSVGLEEMRGFAIAEKQLPVIVVNGKDPSTGGKAFTLLHEFVHVLLGESAISNDASDDPSLTAAERRVERFCDAVAAETLMPLNVLLSFDDVAASSARPWNDEELRPIAHRLGVSREALLLRFVTIGRTTWEFYMSQRPRFREEYRLAAEERAKDSKPVPIKRPVMLMSWNGRGFTQLVLRGYYGQRITLNDVASYLGAKVKHIPSLEEAAFRPRREA
jgi:Zn-dependent peptidase ImmA (M78 family)